jgi:hypothetical protein
LKGKETKIPIENARATEKHNAQVNDKLVDLVKSNQVA